MLPSLLFFALLAPIGGLPLEEEPALDTIQLEKSRRPVEGRIVHINPDRIVLREKSRLREIEREEIEEFSSINEELAAVMPDLRNVTTAIQTQGLESLAKTCEERGLSGEARLVWWSILRLEPENEAAHEALGNRQSKGNWQARLTNRWWTMDKVRNEEPKWRDGYELSTTHFDVRSNLPWFETVRASVMAEEMFVCLYQSLGDQFGLYWPSRRMTLHLHGDHTYDGGADLRATVDREARRVSFDFEKGFQPWLFSRHLSELILAEAAWEQGDGRAAVPMWITIGMEEALQAYLGLGDVAAAKIDFNPEREHTHNRAVHATAEDPYSVSRVLNFAAGDFRRADNELQRAQAYTLFSYCMNGENRTYRKGLEQYFGLALEGRGSISDFRNSLALKSKRDLEEFEEAWHAWVKTR